ncbi:MAG: hypothetical protein IKR86_07625 [Candidatus Methanomethylophilaceae archaeon]|jgi:hypothetical protein|nr:hypothetical protein [Candidatus Methanomethylophilaceae archaeon]
MSDLDNTVKSKMKSDMGLFEKIKMYIPGYKGYKEKNLRRDADRAVRQELSRSIQGSKADLAEVQKAVIDDFDLMMDVERIRTKVDKYDIDIKKAVNGYSAFHDSVKILEADLDRVMAWDAKILDDIQAMREATEKILEMADEGSLARKDLRKYERCIDDMLEDYNQREAIMKGFQSEEEA